MHEDRLIPPTMLYRFSIPCRKGPGKWNARTGVKLTEDYILPSFNELDGSHRFADVRAAWQEDGLYFSVEITTKQQSVWCRDTQLMESDGFQIWIDTRDTHNVHRATRYCHWFLFMPTGGGNNETRRLAQCCGLIDRRMIRRL